MRSYQTVEMVIVDNYNFLNKFEGGISGGEDVRVAFDDGQGSSNIYEFSGKLHSVGSGGILPNKRTAVYKIIALGFTYYGNKVGGRVQLALQNITGTDAIKRIHEEYLRPTDGSLEVDKSKGFLGEEEPYIISNQTPFVAIHTIRARLSSDEFKTGAYCYYRDKDSYKLKQLERMFADLSVQEYFIQDSTMGKSISDFKNQGRNLIQFELGTSFSGEGGKGSPLDTFGVDRKVQTNYFNFGEAFNKGKMVDPSPGKISGTAGLSQDDTDTQYSRQNKIFPGDPRLNSIDPIQEKSNDEQLYANLLKGGPCFTAQVMLDGGLHCTVGKGIYAAIQAPQGSGGLSSDNHLKGEYLIVNIKHHLKINDSTPMGVTTFEAVKGGFSQ